MVIIIIRKYDNVWWFMLIYDLMINALMNDDMYPHILPKLSWKSSPYTH